ncbi:MAG: hypothetical protein COA79_12600 [Planctomycetota bacterium]|nr:MAG: hypothetical protein COA79_12600 [Planctomycetota bacterium]
MAKKKIKDISKSEIKKILKSHEKWIESGERSGEKADFSYTDLNDANLNKANLYGAKLTGAQLKNADLRDAMLYKADLKGADLSNAKLNNANLDQSVLNNANLSGANLSKASFTAAKLRRANLSKANLKGASFFCAKFHGANLTDVQLQKAYLHNVNLFEANISGWNIQDVKCDCYYNDKDGDLRIPLKGDLKPGALKDIKNYADGQGQEVDIFLETTNKLDLKVPKAKREIIARGIKKIERIRYFWGAPDSPMSVILKLQVVNEIILSELLNKSYLKSDYKNYYPVALINNESSNVILTEQVLCLSIKDPDKVYIWTKKSKEWKLFTDSVDCFLKLEVTNLSKKTVGLVYREHDAKAKEYYDKKKYKKSIEHYLAAYEISESLDGIHIGGWFRAAARGKLCNMIGANYDELSQEELSQHYYFKAYKLGSFSGVLNWLEGQIDGDKFTEALSAFPGIEECLRNPENNTQYNNKYIYLYKCVILLHTKDYAGVKSCIKKYTKFAAHEDWQALLERIEKMYEDDSTDSVQDVIDQVKNKMNSVKKESKKTKKAVKPKLKEKVKLKEAKIVSEAEAREIIQHIKGTLELKVPKEKEQLIVENYLRIGSVGHFWGQGNFIYSTILRIQLINKDILEEILELDYVETYDYEEFMPIAIVDNHKSEDQEYGIVICLSLKDPNKVYIWEIEQSIDEWTFIADSIEDFTKLKLTYSDEKSPEHLCAEYNSSMRKYNNEREFDKAVECGLLVHDLTQSISGVHIYGFNDDSSRATLCNKIGILYCELNQRDLALPYYFESYELGDNHGILNWILAKILLGGYAEVLKMVTVVEKASEVGGYSINNIRFIHIYKCITYLCMEDYAAVKLCFKHGMSFDAEHDWFELLIHMELVYENESIPDAAQKYFDEAKSHFNRRKKIQIEYHQ